MNSKKTTILIMKKTILSITIALAAGANGHAQATNDHVDENKTDRTELCRHNYRMLFGGEALTGKGTDPEMMDILQKFIFGDVFATGNLTVKQRELITCVTLASMQTLPQLTAHAGAALNVGATPEELREAIYLTAPFIGFPKTLNAVATVNEVFAKRGISLPLKNQASVTEGTRHARGAAIQDSLYSGGISAVMEGVPDGLGDDVARMLTDYFFGDIYTRGALDIGTRELLGYCILAAIEADSQLQSHYHGNIKAGNSPETVAAAIVQCLPYIGFPAAIKALKTIRQEYTKTAATGAKLVRLSKIVVDPARIDEYNAMLKEEIETSVAVEPGVLTLYAMAEKDAPNKIAILEIYADRDAYESHLKTPHFIKYKQGTLDMVKDLQLIDTNPLIPDMKIK